MVLGGAMFSFDKLNTLIGGGSRKAPVIADVMVSRWAYEALAVAQFKDNPYQKNFYYFDKLESHISYKQAYYIPELESILKESEELVGAITPENFYTLKDNLNILKNEFLKEKTAFPDLDIPDLTRFTPGTFNQDLLENAFSYLSELENKYSRAFNILNEKKTEQIKAMESGMGKENFSRLSLDNENEFLSNLVTRNTAKNKIIRENGELVQIVDPVYLDPTDNLSFRAHFYAPVKNFFGKQTDTLIFNLGVIWFFTLLLCLSLYYDLLARALGFFDKQKK